MTANPYSQHLDKNPANYQPLTPLTLLERSASVYPDHVAIIHGNSGSATRSFTRGRGGSPRRWRSAASVRVTR